MFSQQDQKHANSFPFFFYFHHRRNRLEFPNWVKQPTIRNYTEGSSAQTESWEQSSCGGSVRFIEHATTSSISTVKATTSTTLLGTRRRTLEPRSLMTSFATLIIWGCLFLYINIFIFCAALIQHRFAILDLWSRASVTIYERYRVLHRAARTFDNCPEWGIQFGNHTTCHRDFEVLWID